MASIQNLPKRLYLTLWICLTYVQYGEAGGFRQVELSGTTVFLHGSKMNATFNSIRWKKAKIFIGRFSEAFQSSPTCCVFQPSPVCQCTIFANGSLRLKNVMKNSSGNYTVELYNKEGEIVLTEHIELVVQEAVTLPKVLVSCGLDGNLRVICWVPDSHGIELLWKDSSNKTWRAEQPLNSGSLTPGGISCVAQNEVSRRSSPPVSLTCRGRISLFVALGLFLCVPAFSMAILTFCKQMPKEESEDGKEDFYIPMQGFVGRKEQDGHRENLQTDMSLYVTCRPRQDRGSEDCNKGLKEKTFSLQSRKSEKKATA
ncbi:T-cell surface antigen CD2-like isoform X1 [Arapaima gigas]